MAPTAANRAASPRYGLAAKSGMFRSDTPMLRRRCSQSHFRSRWRVSYVARYLATFCACYRASERRMSLITLEISNVDDTEDFSALDLARGERTMLITPMRKISAPSIGCAQINRRRRTFAVQSRRCRPYVRDRNRAECIRLLTRAAEK